MDLLLDTHAFIWFVENDKQLPAKTKNEIEKEANTIFISMASLWEITIKLSLGKLDVKLSLEKIIKQVAENGFELLPILPVLPSVPSGQLGSLNELFGSPDPNILPYHPSVTPSTKFQ